jgi:DNA-binding FrmR family transcriptional regulator
MNQDTKKNALSRLKRIAGQVTGVQRMVEEERAGPDVLLQVAAVQAAMLETARIVLWDYAGICLAEATQLDQEVRKKKVHELVDLFARFFGTGGGAG